MGIITNRLNDINKEEMVYRINSMLPKNAQIFSNQLDCAIRGLQQFDGNFPRPNHLIVKGKTQAGKTGVLTATIMLIRELNLANALNINKIFYITGDNSCRLTKQTDSRVRECFNGYDECTFTCLKNSDLKDELGAARTELTNAIVFIDESHFGTSKEENIVIKWLEHNYLDMHNPKNLSDKSVYIISNSATPYAEMNSDVAVVKGYAELYTNDWDGKNGYVGFKQYFGNGSIKTESCGLNSKNIREFCEASIAHLNDIKEKTGKTKCALVRMTKTNFKKCEHTINEYFHIEPFFATGENINYSEIENKMEHDCDCYDKPIIFIVAGAYRMGVSIPPYCKQNIGVVFDYATGNAKQSVVTTEQGLLGRVTGYWDVDDWYDMEIHINEKHYKALAGCYVHNKISTPQANTNEVFVEAENGKSYWIVDQNHYAFNDSLINLSGIFSDPNDNKYNIKVQEFFKNPENLKNLDSDWINFFSDAIFFNGRKLKIGSKFPDKAYFSRNEIEKHRGSKGLEDENIGKKCFTFHYKCETNTIDILVGTIAKGDWEIEYDQSIKIVKTLETK